MISGSGSYPHELGLLGLALLLITACAQAPPVSTASPVPAKPSSTSVALTPVATGATPELNPTSTQGEPLFEDDYRLDRGWDLSDQASGAVSLLDGRLVISVRGPGTSLTSLSPVPVLTDYQVEVELVTEICDASDEFGLLVRTSGADTHYRFMVTCGGAVRASRFTEVQKQQSIPSHPLAPYCAAPQHKTIWPFRPSVTSFASWSTTLKC